MSLQMAKSHSLSWLSDIPFCVCVSSPSTHLLTDTSIVCCLCILATVGNDTTNIGMHITFWISVFVFFSKYIPRSGITGSYGSSILSFQESSHCLPQVAIPISIPTNKVCKFPFFHILTNTWWLTMLIIFSCACQPSTCLHWKNVHPCPILIP